MAVWRKIGDAFAAAARRATWPHREEPGSVETQSADRGPGSVVNGYRHAGPRRPVVGAQPGARVGLAVLGDRAGDHHVVASPGGVGDVLHRFPRTGQPEL